MLGVTWDGVIIPCCIDPECEYILGHITRTGFREVWNGPRMQFIRKAMIEGKPEDMKKIAPCDVCSRTNYRPPRGGYTFERIRYEVAKILF
jgi:radical SAM protein with 4Fe4S-binding SPASM domain